MSAPKSLDELAREALPCLARWNGCVKPQLGHPDSCPAYYRPAVLAALKQAVEQEREACAVLADEGARVQREMNRVAAEASDGSDFVVGAVVDIAKRIRARRTEE